jgi:hypothetical protein
MHFHQDKDPLNIMGGQSAATTAAMGSKWISFLIGLYTFIWDTFYQKIKQAVA